MSELIRVPDIGSGDGEVIELFVKVGDRIEADQSILTLESDKASMEIPAPKAGIVKSLKIELGDRLKEGDELLELEIEGAADAAPAAAPAAAAAPAPAAEKPAAAAKKTAKPAKVESEHTREEMQAALGELKEATDAATAKAVISKHGGVAKMAEIPDDKIDAVYEAAKKALEDAAGGEDEDM